MRTAWIVCLAVLLAGSARAAERLVTGGIVRGEELGDGSQVFRAIPYAAPPTGPLRWKPPAPVEPWPGIRDAARPAAPCLQHDEGWNHDDAIKSAEDCLYLSIHTPPHKAGEHLPVMVWIHGGSNKAGSGYGFIDSHIHSRGIVLVAVEYRLGIFGFLASPAQSAESPDRASGNYAIMDQIAALDWVKDNIARFGGDPNNVTIAGQSAGAYDVGILLLSAKARGLFHKAIEESGTPGIGMPVRSQTDNESLGVAFAARLKLAPDADGLKAMREVSGDVLLKEGDALVPPGGIDPSAIWGQAMIDGAVLTRGPKEIMAAHEQAPVPLLIGSNTQEVVVDLPPDAVANITKTFYRDRAEAARKLYDTSDPSLGSVSTQILSDLVFRCPASAMAERQAAAGQKVWRYQFGFGPTVSHSSELKYVFDETQAGWPPLQAYWANFARSGNPNGPGLPRWPRFGKGGAHLDFTPSGPVARKGLRGPLCGWLIPS